MSESDIMEPEYPEGYLEALGEICAVWSNLEADIGRALSIRSEIDYNIFAFIVAHMDARARIDALKAVCLMHSAAKDFPACEKWLNHINGTLRNYRNRIVHDEWSPSSPSLPMSAPYAYKLNPRTKVIRQQSSGERALVLFDNQMIGLPELNGFLLDLKAARQAVYIIAHYTREKGYPQPLLRPTSHHKSHEPLRRVRPDHDETSDMPTSPPPSSQA